MTRQEEIAWAAGLFEGEGCLHLSKEGRFHIVLTTTDEDVIKRLHDIMNVGSINFRHSPSRKNRKPHWTWGVYNRDDVIQVLNLMMPYFGERRTEAAEKMLERTKEIVFKKDAEKQLLILTGLVPANAETAEPKNGWIQP